MRAWEQVQEAPRLPAEAPHRAGCGPGPGQPAKPRSRMGRWRTAVLLGVHLAIAARIVHWKLSGRTLTPLEPSEAGLLASEGLLTAGFLFFVLLILSTLVLGRWFCGWGCHVVALQDASLWLLTRLGIRPRPLRARLLLLVPFLGAFELFFAPLLRRWISGEDFPALRAHLLTEDFWQRFPGPAVALLTFFVAGFACVYLLGAKGFCTYACPYGALFGVADKLAPGRIRVDSSCEGCGHCTAVCTSNVRVHEEVRRFGMVVDSGCMKCLDCVSACPKGALSFGFGPRRVPGKEAPRAAALRRRFDLGWGEELLSALLFLVGLYAFRNLYGAVPFLLALALAVLAALAGLLLTRLVRRAEFAFQHHALKAAGRPTARGFACGAVALLYLSFSGHSALLQWHAREGQSALLSAAAETGAARAAAIERADLSLRRAEGLALLPLPDLDHQLGAIALERREDEEALGRFTAAQRANPQSLPILEQLATVQLRLERSSDLCRTLARTLALLEVRDPAAARERARLLLPRAVELVQGSPGDPAPVLLLCWIQALLGDPATARDNAAKHRQGDPDWLALERRLRAAAPTGTER